VGATGGEVVPVLNLGGAFAESAAARCIAGRDSRQCTEQTPVPL